MGKLLGIDYGERRMGLATAVEATSLAFPLQTIQYDDSTEVIKQIKDICVQEEVTMIVQTHLQNENYRQSQFRSSAV